MMDRLIEKFPDQLREAFEICKHSNLKPHDAPINKVFVAGMGGSGIGAEIVAGLIRDECPVAYCSGKSYEVPAYIDKNTLCMVSSYSGNTEETIQAFHQIISRGPKTVVISSGGKLIELAQSRNLDYLLLPDGWPSPRACVGYSIVQQLHILEKFNLTHSRVLEEVKNSIEFLMEEREEIRESAQHYARLIQGKILVIYTTDRMASIAVRFRQQINENAKALCWHHVIPEMNHNELVGWADKHDDLAVIFLRNYDDSLRNQKRMDITREIISRCTGTVHEVYSSGRNIAEKFIWWIHWVDWVSWYLSQLRGKDSMEVKAIETLKTELAKM